MAGQYEKSSHTLSRTSIHPQSTKNGVWPESSLHNQRDAILRSMKWSADAKCNPGQRNYARAYEFRWSDVPGQQRCDMCEFGLANGMADDASFDAEIRQWIAETGYREDVPLRLFVSNQVTKFPLYGLSLTRGAFEAIEKDFGLHPATVKTLRGTDDYGGVDFVWSSQQEPSSSTDGSTWSVFHFEPMHMHAASWSISLRYDHQRQSTYAMLVATEAGEQVVEQVINQLLILHKSWKQYRVLPEAFLQIYLGECLHEVCDTRSRVLAIERKLGATLFLGSAKASTDDWPQNVDVRHNTAELHGCLYNTALERNVLQKIRQVQQTLQNVEAWLEQNQKAATPQYLTGARDLGQYSAWTDTLIQQFEKKFEESHARAQIQAGLLFSIVGQQDSHESISMAQSTFVFTFITALFLPCTLVASIFSMSMFNWQPDADPDSEAAYISDKFWIYWAFSLPLTILVMGGWYWWSLKGMKIWQRSSSKANEDVQGWRAKSRWMRFLGRRPKSKNT